MLIRNSHQAEAVWDRTVRRPVTIYKAAIAQPFGSYGFPIKYGGQSLYRPAPYLYISQTHVPEGTLAIGSQHSNSKQGDNSLPPDWFGAMPNPLGITNRSDCYPPLGSCPGWEVEERNARAALAILPSFRLYGAALPTQPMLKIMRKQHRPAPWRPISASAIWMVASRPKQTIG